MKPNILPTRSRNFSNWYCSANEMWPKSYHISPAVSSFGPAQISLWNETKYSLSWRVYFTKRNNNITCNFYVNETVLKSYEQSKKHELQTAQTSQNLSLKKMLTRGLYWKYFGCDHLTSVQNQITSYKFITQENLRGSADLE